MDSVLISLILVVGCLIVVVLWGVSLVTFIRSNSKFEGVMKLRKEMFEIITMLKKDTNSIARGQLLHEGLHKTALVGSVEILKYLISEGADMNAKNNNGFTPLDIAIERRRTVRERHIGEWWCGTSLAADEYVCTEVVEYLENMGAKSGKDLP